MCPETQAPNAKSAETADTTARSAFGVRRHVAAFESAERPRTPNIALAFAPSWGFDTINRNETKFPLGRRIADNRVCNVRTGAVEVGSNSGLRRHH